MRHKTDEAKYAFLMIDYKTPEFIKEIKSKIKADELYTEEDNDDYGIEKRSHVTIVPCLENNININELKKYLDNIDEYGIILGDISKFENDKFDVLKCSVISRKLQETNKKIVSKFKTHSEYKEYKPHLTIAYMKHGMADKYLMNHLNKVIYLEPKNFNFSYYDENNKHKNLKL